MLKKKLLQVLLLISISTLTWAQNVSILPTGITAAPSTNFPRLTNDQILALSNPEKGDLAYDLTFNCLRVYNGTKWLHLLTAQDLGQASCFAWLLGSNEALSSNGLVKDQSGNIYITGNFKGTGFFGNTNVVSGGDNDVFLAKYNSEGVIQWVRTAASPAGDISTDICLDQNGNIFITGYYFDAINFGGTTLPNSGSSDVFVCKYDPSGNVLWVKKAGGAALDISNSVDVDASGNVYLGGYFLGSCTFFGTSNITIASSGMEDGLLTKLDINGNVLWAKGIQGLAIQKVNDVLISGTDTFVLGISENIADFGNSNSLNSGVGNIDVFVAKYNTLGDCQSVIGFGGTGTDKASRLNKDESSSILVCGSIYQNATICSFNLTSSGGYDAFFVKLNSNLDILNAKLIGGSSNEDATDIGVDVAGNIFLVGVFNGSMSNGLKTIISNGGSYIFVSKFSSNGSSMTLLDFGGSDFDSTSRIFVGTNLFISGTFSQSVNFGNILTSMGTSLNGYVLRIPE